MASSLNINLLPKIDTVKNDDEEIPCTHRKSTLENFFSAFRRNVIGHRQGFESPFGKKEIIYADWTASGKAYQPIEAFIQKEMMPFVANTHTETTITGTLMSKAYEKAKLIIKQHVNANNDDVLIFCGSGMTGAVNKLQRILGMRVPARLVDYMNKETLKDVEALKNHVSTVHRPFSQHLPLDEDSIPVVFVTHMEHNSNHITWLETIATVEIIKSCEN